MPAPKPKGQGQPRSGDTTYAPAPDRHLHDFMTSSKALLGARDLLSRNYDSLIAPLLERRILDRDISLTAEEHTTLHSVNMALAALEQTLCLERRRTGALTADQQALKTWGLDLLNNPRNPALRRYLRARGHKHTIAAVRLDIPDRELFTAYGSLMPGQGGPAEAKARAGLEHIGPCLIEGLLYSRGDYPALMPGRAMTVKGILFSVPGISAFEALDELEHYDPGTPDQSVYRRRLVRLREPAVDAWVYYWNRSLKGLPLIASGSWLDR